MRRIIYNKVYDTETAQLIGKSVLNNEFLYRKKTGEYFLSNATSLPKTLSIVKNNKNFKLNGILPLSFSEAQELIQNHLVDQSESTNTATTTLLVTCSKETKSFLELQKSEHNLTFRETIDQTIACYKDMFSKSQHQLSK